MFIIEFVTSSKEIELVVPVAFPHMVLEVVERKLGKLRTLPPGANIQIRYEKDEDIHFEQANGLNSERKG